MRYRGWQNYETWLASLYLDDVDWQNFVETELLLLEVEEDEEITIDKKVEMLAEYLKDSIEEEAAEAAAAGLSDFLYMLLIDAIFEIDFTELASVFLDV